MEAENATNAPQNEYLSHGLISPSIVPVRSSQINCTLSRAESARATFRQTAAIQRLSRTAFLEISATHQAGRRLLGEMNRPLRV